MSWTSADIPDLSGKTFVITGANSGLGLQTALAIARKRGHVVMACRNVEKAERAAELVREQAPGAAPYVVPLDLGDLDSVRRAATEIEHRYARIDVLCNNAGVMAIPRRETASGFEVQFGTNHLGHFALTGLLLERLLGTPGARVVNVSSLMHRYGKMRFDDLHGQRSYEKWSAYAQSKLANLLFTFELARRLSSRGRSLMSVATHPGYAATELQGVGPEMSGSRLMKLLTDFGNIVMAQSSEMGALPTLYAATAPAVASGDYYGPNGFRQLRGYPRKVGCHPRARSEADARTLWNASVDATGVTYAAL